MTYEVLDSIDNIEDAILESSSSMIDSLFKTYEKSAIILENYEGDDLSSFSIFQEGEIMDNFKERGKGMSVLMKILSALPRFVMAIIDKIKKNSHKGVADLQNTLNKMSDEDKKTLIALECDNKKVSLPKRIFNNILEWLKSINLSIGKVIGGASILSVLVLIVYGGNKLKKEIFGTKQTSDENDKKNKKIEALFKDEEIVKLVTEIRKKYEHEQKRLCESFNDVITYWNEKMPNCKKIFGSDKKYEIEQVKTLELISENTKADNSDEISINVNASITKCQVKIVGHLGFKNGIGKDLATGEEPLNIFYNESKTKHRWDDTQETMKQMVGSIRENIIGITVPEAHTNSDVKTILDLRVKELYDSAKSSINNIKHTVERLIENVNNDKEFPNDKKREFENNTNFFLQFINELWNFVLKIDVFNHEFVKTYNVLSGDIRSFNTKIRERVRYIESKRFKLGKNHN